jgi:hypothetical protein
MFTIFKPPECLDKYIILRANGSGIEYVGFKIGNNVTQDDIWHPIYVKFEEKVLN